MNSVAVDLDVVEVVDPVEPVGAAYRDLGRLDRRGTPFGRGRSRSIRPASALATTSGASAGDTPELETTAAQNVGGKAVAAWWTNPDQLRVEARGQLVAAVPGRCSTVPSSMPADENERCGGRVGSSLVEIDFLEIGDREPTHTRGRLVRVHDEREPRPPARPGRRMKRRREDGGARATLKRSAERPPTAPPRRTRHAARYRTPRRAASSASCSPCRRAPAGQRREIRARSECSRSRPGR